MRNTEDSRWYQRSWFVVLALIVFFPVGIFLLWRYTSWSKVVKGIVTIVAILWGLPMWAAILSGDTESPSQPTSTPTPTPSVAKSQPSPPSKIEEPTPEPGKLEYEVLYEEKLPTLENYSLLVEAGLSEVDLEELIKQFERESCTQSCNISVFDNRKVFELDQQRKQLTSPAELTAWDTKNYVFVADHLVAWLTFDTGEVWHYPLRDFKYEELK